MDSQPFSFEDGSIDAPNLNSSTFYSSHHGGALITDHTKLVWGTSINVEETLCKIKDCIISTYPSEISHAIDTETSNIYFDCSKIANTSLFEELYLYPTDMIHLLERAFDEILKERIPQWSLKVKVSLLNIGKELDITNMDVLSIDRLVYLCGIITRVSKCVPVLVESIYSCNACSKHLSCKSPPMVCECNAMHSYTLNYAKSTYKDSQIMQIQKVSGTGGISCISTTMTKYQPGDHVKVVGVLKATPVVLTSTRIKSTFRVSVTVNSISPLSPPPVNIACINIQNTYSSLSALIAPSVYGLVDTKKSLLLQLVGCSKKGTYRGDIHILLAGDPGTAKSQLLAFMNKVSPKGISTSGRGSTAVGLSSAVSKCPESGEFILEPGALILSHGGLCCIDEFDKMGFSNRSILHEAMEQQTISISKAGIVSVLKCECSVLASCNPVESRWSVGKSIVENINIGAPLLSRFDIVCIIIDKPDEENDKEVAMHMINLFNTNINASTSENITTSINSENINASTSEDNIMYLKSCIQKCKQLSPTLSEEAREYLCTSYTSLRSLNNGRTITATTRQLESLIRLSEAHARLRLSPLIEIVDAEEALRLLKSSMMFYAIDPETGRIDMDLVMTGKSTAMREKVKKLKGEILTALMHNSTLTGLKESLGEDALIEEALKELEAEELINVDWHNGTVTRIL